MDTCIIILTFQQVHHLVLTIKYVGHVGVTRFFVGRSGSAVHTLLSDRHCKYFSNKYKYKKTDVVKERY